jgi:hypothetical protein
MKAHDTCKLQPASDDKAEVSPQQDLKTPPASHRYSEMFSRKLDFFKSEHRSGQLPEQCLLATVLYGEKNQLPEHEDAEDITMLFKT